MCKLAEGILGRNQIIHLLACPFWENAKYKSKTINCKVLKIKHLSREDLEDTAEM